MEIAEAERQLKIISSSLEVEEVELANEHLVELLEGLYDMPASPESLQILTRIRSLGIWDDPAFTLAEMELMSHEVEHLGHLNRYAQARETAKELSIKALAQQEEEADAEFRAMMLVTAYFWIGLSYQKEGQYAEAVDWFRKLMEIEVVPAEQAMNYELRLATMLNLGICYRALKDNRRATKYLSLLQQYQPAYGDPEQDTYDPVIAQLISHAGQQLQALTEE
jgi:tetratricopeptide (TPR) repeat protein